MAAADIAYQLLKMLLDRADAGNAQATELIDEAARRAKAKA